MATEQLLERKDKKRGRNISIGIHLLLLLIAFFYFWPKGMKATTPPPPIIVSIEFKESSLSKYAHSDAGKKKPKSESVKKMETTKPKKVVVKTPKVVIPTPKPPSTKPTDPIVSKTTIDESPVVAVEEEMEVEIPEPEIIPEVVEEVIVEEVEEVPEEVITEEDLEELLEEEMEGKESAEEASTEASTGTSGSDNTDSSIDGEDGTGESNTGDGDGATSGDDGDEGIGEAGSGTGDYDGSGDGVFGRKIIKRNWRGLFKGGNQSKGKGKIAVKICVDRMGDVRHTEILFSETTETNKQKLKQALEAAKGYKVQEDPSAPEEQCGKLIFNLDINAFKTK